jgi:hypothetical protein
MATLTKGRSRRIFLLTVWQESEQAETDPPGWRFHLTDPHTDKHYGFTNPEALIATLQQLANDHPPADDGA